MDRVTALLRGAFISLSFALVEPTAALAWGADGHRFACTVASYEMGEAARTAVKRLLGIETREQFAENCSWADEIVTQRPATLGWHRMYVPRDAQTVDRGRDCAGPDTCMIGAVERNLAVLTSSRPDSEKGEALKYVMHLVADLHQPLNVGYVQDQGGASIPATFRGRKTSLRDIWEVGLLGARPEAWREIADSYATRFTAVERGGWTQGTLIDWANESLWIARTPATGYLGNPGNLDFGALYIKQNQLTAIRRLSQAGVRLASLLNRAFPQ